jgi:Sec-independent protein translocase protein TatA
MHSMGRVESLVSLVVLGLIVFGRGRLPTAMRDLGKARRILKAEAQALRDGVPLAPPRTIVADPGDVTRHDARD